MAARWVGQSSGPIFRCLRTKIYQIKFVCAGMFVVCNAVFRLSMFCCVLKIFAIKSQICQKSCQNFVVFGLSNFGGRSPKFLTEFYKSGPA